VNLPGRANISPLIAAAFNGNADLVGRLEQRGADIAAQDATGKTAIVYAAARGSVPIVERLLSRGVDVNARYRNDLTILMWAAGQSEDAREEDGVRLVTVLLEHGARPNDVDDRGRTALMTAAEQGHAAIVTLLLGRGADRDLRDHAGKTALDLAVSPAVRQALAP
jgi:uncharacterized protein